MIGTGLYLGDIQATMGQLEALASSSIATTLLWIAGIAVCRVDLICSSSLLLNVSEQGRGPIEQSQQAQAAVAGIGFLVVAAKALQQLARCCRFTKSKTNYASFPPANSTCGLGFSAI